MEIFTLKPAAQLLTFVGLVTCLTTRAFSQSPEPLGKSVVVGDVVCGFSTEKPPTELPVDACRDGTLAFGPVLIERSEGQPSIETYSFDTAGEMHACVSIQTSGGDRQRVSGSWIDLDGDRIAGPKLFGQNVTTVELRQVLPAGHHTVAAQLRGPVDTWAEVSVYVGGDGMRNGLVTSDHLELFNLFADPQTFHGDVEPTRLTADGTALALPGLPSGDTFRVRWRFEILSVGSCAIVRTLSGETIFGAVATFRPEARWDGRDDAGAEVPEGTYAYRLIADLVRISRGGETIIDSLATAVQTLDLDRIEGWVDLHTHPLSHLGFGEKAMHGAPDVGLTIGEGNLACNDEAVIASSVEEALGSCNGAHGGWGLDNPCGDYLRMLLVRVIDAGGQYGGGLLDLDHPHAGYPDFPYWPHRTSILHQQMWWEWLKRARDGGQRVIVALAVNNELLAEILNGNTPYDDRAVAERQIQETIRMVEQHGDFMEIARSPADVVRIAADGKLAVVLGVEIDRIGNFGVNEPASEATIRDEIRHLYSLGIRYVFPVHLVDNAFGGSAVYDMLFSFANKRANGYHFHVETSPDPNVTYNAAEFLDLPLSPGIADWGAANINLVTLHELFDGIGAAPAACVSGDPPCAGLLACCSSFQEITNIFALSPELDGYLLIPPGHVNARGLTAEGEIAIDEMMKLGMIIDVDHMSQKTMERTIEIAEGTGAGYPLVIGHSGIRGEDCSEPVHCSERMPSFSDAWRIHVLGGMAGAGSANATPDEFIAAHRALQGAMGPDFVGIGTDVNGFEPLPKRIPEDATCVPDRAASDAFYAAFFAANPAITARSGIMGSSHEWDYVNECGVSQYGLMPEFLFDLRSHEYGEQVYESMMRSTVGFIRMWQKVEAVSAQLW